MTQQLLKAETRYYPFDLPAGRWAESNYWFDERKMNLLWLLHPEVDQRHSEYWAGDSISWTVDNCMTPLLRGAMALPPVEAVRMFEWGKMEAMLLPIHVNLPTMWRRAKEANARLMREQGQAPNVYYIDFSKYGGRT